MNIKKLKMNKEMLIEKLDMDFANDKERFNYRDSMLLLNYFIETMGLVLKQKIGNETIYLFDFFGVIVNSKKRITGTFPIDDINVAIYQLKMS